MLTEILSQSAAVDLIVDKVDTTSFPVVRRSLK